MSMCTAISAWYWLRDPRTVSVPLTESLWIHPVFTIATLTLSKIPSEKMLYNGDMHKNCSYPGDGL